MFIIHNYSHTIFPMCGVSFVYPSIRDVLSKIGPAGRFACTGAACFRCSICALAHTNNIACTETQLQNRQYLGGRMPTPANPVKTLGTVRERAVLGREVSRVSERGAKAKGGINQSVMLGSPMVQTTFSSCPFPFSISCLSPSTPSVASLPASGSSSLSSLFPHCSLSS